MLGGGGWRCPAAGRVRARAAVSTFTYQVGERDAEKIRWYLEDYLEFPADPAPVVAADAETRLAELGTGLFRQVFTGKDAAGIWAQAQARLGQVRVEVDTDPADAPGLPWELLRDPGTGTALALGAGEFVRTHLQTAGQVSLPQAAGDGLRVLLVICRPGRGDDVPFRSVASRLVRGGAGNMEGLHLDVLRPATFARLAEVLRPGGRCGPPIPRGALRRPRHLPRPGGPLARRLRRPGAGRGQRRRRHRRQRDRVVAVAVWDLGGGTGAARAARVPDLRRPGPPTNQQFADGPTLGRLLTATGVPVLVLNACRSA